MLPAFLANVVPRVPRAKRILSPGGESARLEARHSGRLSVFQYLIDIYPLLLVTTWSWLKRNAALIAGSRGVGRVLCKALYG